MLRRGVRGRSILILLALLVIGVLVSQAVTMGGVPDPTARHLSPAAGTGILVLLEGLESILVLSAITASLSRVRWDVPSPPGPTSRSWRPVPHSSWSSPSSRT